LKTVKNILRGLLEYFQTPSKKKSKIKAEYALRDLRKLMSVAEYSTETQKKLSKEIDSLLPPIEEIEEELEKDMKI